MNCQDRLYSNMHPKEVSRRWFFEQCETLRAMTAGRRSRSARLLVGSTPSSRRNRNTFPRSCCAPTTQAFSLPLSPVQGLLALTQVVTRLYVFAMRSP